jgi:hypothetical protein
MSQNALALAPGRRDQSVLSGPVVYIIIITPYPDNHAFLLKPLLENYLRTGSHRTDRTDFISTAHGREGYLVRAFRPRGKPADGQHGGASASILIDVLSCEKLCIVCACNNAETDVVSTYRAEITAEALGMYRAVRALFRTAGHPRYNRHMSEEVSPDARHDILEMKANRKQDFKMGNHLRHISFVTMNHEVSINELADLYYGQITTQHNKTGRSDSRGDGSGGRRGGRGGGGSHSSVALRIGGEVGGMQIDIQTHNHHAAPRQSYHHDTGAKVCKSLYMTTGIYLTSGTSREFTLGLAKHASSTFKAGITHTNWKLSSHNSIVVVRRVDQAFDECGKNEWYTFVACSPQLIDDRPATSAVFSTHSTGDIIEHRPPTRFEQDHIVAFRLMCERAASGIIDAKFTIPHNMTRFNPQRHSQSQEAVNAIMEVTRPECWTGAIVLETIYYRVLQHAEASATGQGTTTRNAHPRQSPPAAGPLALQ